MRSARSPSSYFPSCIVVSRPSRAETCPVSDGQPTHIPATGITRCGSFSISLTFAEWSRITLIGQVPSPTASAAAMKVASTMPASTAALKN